MKKMIAIFLAAAAFVLVGCSTPYSLARVPKNTTLLDPSTPVAFVFAYDVPVAPPGAEYKGTIQTEEASWCSEKGTVETLKEKARSVGANLIYVKKINSVTGFLYTQFYSQVYTCVLVLADFFYAESELQTAIINHANDKQNQEAK